MNDVLVEDLQARVRELEDMITQSSTSMMLAFKLPPIPHKILTLLLKLKVVTAEMIEVRLDISSDARVAVHRLRSRMRLYGIDIKHQRGHGYYLTPEAKDRIRALVQAFDDGDPAWSLIPISAPVSAPTMV
jgi:Protein of unknown function (DUF2782).